MARFILIALVVCGSVAGGAAAFSSGSAAAESLPAPSGSRQLDAVPAATAPACAVPLRFRSAFRAAAEDARLPASLLAAVAYVESRFEPGARSPRGAIGLLQVMPSTAAALGLDADRPETNVLAGARFLRAMLDRFGSSDLALAAYNAGPAAVERAGGAPSGETLRYVIDVTARWRAGVGCAL